MPDTTKGAWRLQEVRDQIIAGELLYVEAGTLWVWGDGARGALGQNDSVPRSSPIQIPGTQWVKSGFRPVNPRLGGGAIKSNGELWVWGNRQDGVLGQNNLIYYSSPVQVPGTQWKVLSGGSFHSLALKKDGTLWGWGSNEGGKLGINDSVHRSSPVQIPGDQWQSVSAGRTMSHAIKSDNTLWAWGGSYCGLLGINNLIARSSPVQIPGTQWCFVSNSYTGAAAIKTDGTLWVWGANYRGQLGLNTRSTAYDQAVSSPTQVPGTQWVEAYVGNDSPSVSTSIGRKSDGTLWTWGSNAYGAIGDNTAFERSSPVQVSGTQWVSAAAGKSFNVARKSDGTLYTWGRNQTGQLGINSTASQCVPQSVTGNLWIDATAGDSVYAIKAC